MDAFIAAALLVLGLAIGAVSTWIIRGRDNRRLLQELTAEREAGAQRTAAFSEMSRKADDLATQLQQEKVARATAEAGAHRVAGLETQLRDAQSSAQRLVAAKAEAEAIAARVPGLDVDLKFSKEREKTLSAEVARLETERDQQKLAFDEKLGALTTVRGEIDKELRNLAAEALAGNQQSFLTLANEVFERHRETAAGDLDQRKKAIESLLAPVTTSLEEYRKGLGEMEKARLEAYVELSTELKNVVRTQAEVRAETNKLVNALRAAPKTRGRWGEQQLHNVLELSGMTPYVDFSPEESFEREDERLRPDAILRLPGDRNIVVDAKTSMSAYLDAVEAVDEMQREEHLRKHAQQLRSHMKQLSAKSYWDALTVTPDFVVMFVPGDNFFAAAMERDPQLFEDAIKFRVLIVTPTTLVALAKAIAFGWRQEKVAENARRVAELGRDLYKRLAVMGGHISDLGNSLERTVKTYNGFIGSIEGSVMPQARKFTELEVEGTQDALPELGLVETDVRAIREDRDLIVPSAEIIKLPASESGSTA